MSVESSEVSDEVTANRFPLCQSSAAANPLDTIPEDTREEQIFREERDAWRSKWYTVMGGCGSPSPRARARWPPQLLQIDTEGSFRRYCPVASRAQRRPGVSTADLLRAISYSHSPRAPAQRYSAPRSLSAAFVLSALPLKKPTYLSSILRRQCCVLRYSPHSLRLQPTLEYLFVLFP